MSDDLSSQDLKLAYQAALAMRRETCLARYPRALKLGAALFFLVAGSAPFLAPSTHKPLATADGPVADSGVQEEAAVDDGVKPVQTGEGMRFGKGAFHPPQTEPEKQAATANDSDEPTRGMVRLPVLSLQEESPHGFLPVVAKDGRKPWQVYARPFNHQDPRPRIALVIADMGLSKAATDAVLNRVPPAVTLSFDAQADALPEWLARARQEGHETILSLPMEPHDYPRSDPGPMSLLTSLPNSDLIQRLYGFLARGMGYVGITTLSGSRFSADSDKVSVVLEEIKKRGLVVFDAKLTGNSMIEPVAEKLGLPSATASRVIDKEPTPEMIDAALLSLEQTARVDGAVIALASPYPVTLERLSLWMKNLSDRGFVLAPLTAVVR